MKFNVEFGEIFFINSTSRDIKHLIEDKHYKNLENNENSEINEEELLKILSQEQLHFYNTKVKNKMIKLYDTEFEDLIGTIQDYINSLLQEEIEEKISLAPTNAEKIELAKYRDVYIKEAKHGKR